ncbi:GNAT family N-acetyltransferase [Halochromatium roseum]|uniref:GNAT family N-acetyltransferase n=1 Tax=Halochromatium roseum TaxID=391920 RepID=UPI001912B2F0|nr:GNAT family N-acetyltransferase [Halochromatium roseum]MBK5938257.1 GNAT family N-acetyltransferase [Halochromatium roseum]
MPDNLQTLTATGAEIERHIPALAELRISVFREFPYLYDGDAAYEARYLETYRQARGSVVVIVLDGERVVGASTALPMAEETDEVKAPFLAQGYDPERIFYLGESVLLPAYRGRGLGVRFFEERERHAQRLCELGAGYGDAKVAEQDDRPSAKPSYAFDWYAFYAVQRDTDDPRRPADYVPLNRFWHKRGYQCHPELSTRFSWKEFGEPAETPKPMLFWLKAARPSDGASLAQQ